MRSSLLRVRELARKELRQLLRDPRTRGMVFVAPVLQLLLFGYAVNTDIRQVPVFVVDHDNTDAARHLVDALVASDYFRIAGHSARSADAERALNRGTAKVSIEIPPGFARDAESSAGADVQVMIDGSNSNTATIVQGNIARIMQSVNQDIVAARTGSKSLLPIELRARAWYNPELLSRVYNVPAVIGALLQLMCLLLTSMAVVREREIGTLEQLMVSPLRAREFLLGKTLPVLFVALVDLALISVVAILWFAVPFRGSVLVLLGAALLFIITGIAMGLLLSTISRTQQEAFMAMFLLFLPLIILSGMLLPIRNMPAVFQWLTLLNPMRHFLEIVRVVFLKGQGVSELWPQLLALSALSLGTLALAVTKARRLLV
jgi:ABC-2 type transport system permease protein